MAIYLSGDSFSSVPQLNPSLRWDDFQGKEVFEKTKYACTEYQRSMEEARKHAQAFQRHFTEVDRILRENPPTLRTNV